MWRCQNNKKKLKEGSHVAMQGQGLCQARTHTHKHKTTKPQFYKTTPNLIQRRGGMSVIGQITNYIPRSFLTL